MASKNALKAEARSQEQIMGLLRELGGARPSNDVIAYGGKELRIPDGMDIRGARRFLGKVEEEQETETQFVKVFNYRPWDGAYCMQNVFKSTFGAVSHQGTPGFFFFPGEPPRMITVPNGIDSTIQIPWGNFELPVPKGVTFSTGQMDHSDLGPLFQLEAFGPKKYEGEIQGLFNLIEEELKSNSMYRGKAFDGQGMPEFVDLRSVDPSKVVYSQEVMRQLEAKVWAVMRYPDAFNEDEKKLAILLHGEFGTGKTLAAILTGQVATDNGWTFIKGRPGRDNLGFVMQTARLYQPCVVFYEDLDQVADPADMSNSDISKLLDDFDGIDAKGTQIVCVLTTNYPDRIQQGMTRPGRLDHMIEISDLDEEGVAKLVQVYLGDDLLSDGIDWHAVYKSAEGYKPAFIAALAKVAKSYAIVRNGGKVEGIKLVTADLVEAADDMRDQHTRHVGGVNRHEKPTLEAAFQDTIRNTLHDTLGEHVLAENGS